MTPTSLHRIHFLLALLVLIIARGTQAQPTELSYEIASKQVQDTTAFVQGFTFHDNKLYLSTGGYGESRVQIIEPDTGKVEIEAELADRYFGEGIAILNNRLAQLTWRSGLGFLRDPTTLKIVERFRIPGEGWGITASDSGWVMSDGSSYLTFLDPETMKITRKVQVTLNERPLARLNELEMIDGYIWANIWFESRVVLINPDNGRVEATLDLSKLLPKEERKRDTDVLNGIAFNPASNTVWVTGKRWPWRYQLEILPARPKLSQ